MMHFYPDLQYCRRELKGDERVLEYLSLFVQGKIEICDFLKIQEYIFMDNECLNLQDNPDLEFNIKEILNETLPWEEH
jgi:hypothetical protein